MLRDTEMILLAWCLSHIDDDSEEKKVCLVRIIWGVFLAYAALCRDVNDGTICQVLWRHKLCLKNKANINVGGCSGKWYMLSGTI